MCDAPVGDVSTAVLSVVAPDASVSVSAIGTAYGASPTIVAPDASRAVTETGTVAAVPLVTDDAPSESAMLATTPPNAIATWFAWP